MHPNFKRTARPRRPIRCGRTRADYVHFCSAYRAAAHEYGIPREKFYSWLATMDYRDKPGIHTGAGLLMWSGCRAPISAHDAALRVLAGWAPGLIGVDLLQARANLAQQGFRWPTWRRVPEPV
ncbi:MAG TPA: hypothetical protein VGF12_07200 [Roseateles sp.]|uniref:hypothetical protein n=1 Tax=Roseateles sp. TaxID=1971397 RepID=UPI002EDB0273